MASTRNGKAGRPRLRGRGTPPRLASGERRRDLLRVAAGLLTRHGVDAVQMAEVATTGGVSRQLVYRFFPSRPALLRGVLEDFADALTREFGRHAMDRLPADVEEATQVYVEAVCDTIEAQGAGPWHLLDSKGPDREIGRLGQEIMQRLILPWHTRISRVTGSGEREAAIVARMLVAAARAALDLWCSGEISREEAVRHATRGVTALLATLPPPSARRARLAWQPPRRPPSTRRSGRLPG
jgi:AcrR family transcriptional regulator